MAAGPTWQPPRARWWWATRRCAASWRALRSASWRCSLPAQVGVGEGGKAGSGRRNCSAGVLRERGGSTGGGGAAAAATPAAHAVPGLVHVGRPASRHGSPHAPPPACTPARPACSCSAPCRTCMSMLAGNILDDEELINTLAQAKVRRGSKGLQEAARRLAGATPHIPNQSRVPRHASRASQHACCTSPAGHPITHAAHHQQQGIPSRMLHITCLHWALPASSGSAGTPVAAAADRIARSSPPVPRLPAPLTRLPRPHMLLPACLPTPPHHPRQVKCDEIAKRVAEAEVTEKEIDATSEQYRPVAATGALPPPASRHPCRQRCLCMLPVSPARSALWERSCPPPLLRPPRPLPAACPDPPPPPPSRPQPACCSSALLTWRPWTACTSTAWPGLAACLCAPSRRHPR